MDETVITERTKIPFNIETVLIETLKGKDEEVKSYIENDRAEALETFCNLPPVSRLFLQVQTLRQRGAAERFARPHAVVPVVVVVLQERRLLDVQIQLLETAGARPLARFARQHPLPISPVLPLAGLDRLAVRPAVPHVGKSQE